MFFILSKTLNYLTMPLVIVCIVLVASAIIRHQRWKKRLFVTGLILLLFFSNEFIANEIMLAWEPKPTPYDQIDKPYDWGIVLTGVTLSQLTPKDRVYFSRGADRVTHAVQLYKLGKVRKLLVSGGSGRLLDIKEREADDVKEALIMMGVPENAIFTETASRNTRESAMQVKNLLAGWDQSSDRCLLITSAFHMRRSVACYRKVGLAVDTFTTDFFAHPRTWTPDVLIIPKVEALSVWHKLLREWTGFVAYKFSGYV